MIWIGKTKMVLFAKKTEKYFMQEDGFVIEETKKIFYLTKKNKS